MVAISTRASVLAVVVESTEGTPVAPSATTEYTAIQVDADMNPSFDSLQNEELRSTLAPGKNIFGFENPTFGFSHYMRNGGTAGTAVDFNDLLKAAWGAEAVASTEYDTVSSSTVSVINVDTGEGSTFQRGEALLIKDPTNGYNVRNIDTIATDALSIGFNLPVAPGTGVNLGKSVLYYPAESGHQSLSFWHYVGNGGFTQLLSGGRVTELNIDYQAGQLINCSYSVEGLKYYWNPITIGSADRYLDFTDDGGTKAAVVEAKTYRDPHELAAALQAAIALVSTETITVVYSNTTGKFTIACSSGILSLLWQSGTNTANTIGDKIGFDTSANDTSAITYTSDNAISFASGYTPAFDSQDPLVAKYGEVLLGDATNTTVFPASTVNIKLSTPRRPIESISAETGRSGSIINARTCTISLTALLDKYEADKFRKFRSNESTKFAITCGLKNAQGNWTAGTCVNFYTPTCVVSSIDTSESDGLFAVSLELTCFTAATLGECFLNFV
jgi:hypothetical protein